MEEELKVEQEIEFTEEQLKEMYGEIPENVIIAPTTHGLEEAYEIGDTNI